LEHISNLMYTPVPL